MGGFVGSRNQTKIKLKKNCRKIKKNKPKQMMLFCEINEKLVMGSLFPTKLYHAISSQFQLPILLL